MAAHVIEGTWEEIKRHESELAGRLLRVTIIPEKAITGESSAPPQEAPSIAPTRRVSAMGKYAGILSSEDFMRRKQEEIDLEDRRR